MTKKEVYWIPPIFYLSTTSDFLTVEMILQSVPQAIMATHHLENCKTLLIWQKAMHEVSENFTISFPVAFLYSELLLVFKKFAFTLISVCSFEINIWKLFLTNYCDRLQIKLQRSLHNYASMCSSMVITAKSNNLNWKTMWYICYNGTNNYKLYNSRNHIVHKVLSLYYYYYDN